MPILFLVGLFGLAVVAKKKAEGTATVEKVAGTSPPAPPVTMTSGTDAATQAQLNAQSEGHYRLRVELEAMGLGYSRDSAELKKLDYETLRKMVLELERTRELSAQNLVSKAYWPITAKQYVQGIVNPSAYPGMSGPPMPNTQDGSQKDADAHQRMVGDLVKKGCMKGAGIVQAKLVATGNPYAVAGAAVLRLGGSAVVCNNVAVYVWDGYKWADSKVFGGKMSETIEVIGDGWSKVQATKNFVIDLKSNVYGKIPGIGPFLDRVDKLLLNKAAGYVVDKGQDLLDKIF